MLQLDPADPNPPYAQVLNQLAGLIRAGTLPAGTRLPAIRHLANDLDLAANTVARAYRELEADGLVETRGRHGTVVAAPASAADRDAAVAADAAVLARTARSRGLGLEETLDAVRLAFAAPQVGNGTA